MTEEYKATVSRAGGGGEETEARKAKDVMGNRDRYFRGCSAAEATLLAEGVFVRDRGRKVMA